MSWLSSFFRKDTVQVILKASLGILKLFIGNAAGALQQAALEEVKKAESTGLSGAAKWDAAYKGVKNRLPHIAEKLIEKAIIDAVLVVDPKL